MSKRLLYLVMLCLGLVWTSPALAQPKIEMSTKAQKEVTVTVDGKTETRLVPADPVVPGDLLQFTLTVVNQGSEQATGLVINNPVPEGTVFQVGSAFGPDADITFSIDAGATFKKPAMLTYEVKLPDGRTEKRMASPEQYTHLRWQLATLAPGATVDLGFQVRVK